MDVIVICTNVVWIAPHPLVSRKRAPISAVCCRRVITYTSHSTPTLCPEAFPIKASDHPPRIVGILCKGLRRL
jgi:hypothetical protein